MHRQPLVVLGRCIRGDRSADGRDRQQQHQLLEQIVVERARETA